MLTGEAGDYCWVSAALRRSRRSGQASGDDSRRVWRRRGSLFILRGVHEGSGEQAKSAVEQPSAGDEPLQFDKAEVAFSGLRVCASCQGRFDREYFEAGGKFICPACAGILADDRTAYLLRAALFGAGAALVGTLVWFLVIKLSGSEFGLIAIAVGLFVGFAVRYGARGRGGARYQALAMALTYFSITASYVPLVIEGMGGSDGAGDGAHGPSKDAATGSAAPALTGERAPLAVPTEPAAAPLAPAGAHRASAGSVAVALLLVFGIALASPFLAGFSNIMGILIIGIALYEAWKLNKRIVVTGPYQMSAAPEAVTP